jgi:hypothetical protein
MPPPSPIVGPDPLDDIPAAVIGVAIGRVGSAVARQCLGVRFYVAVEDVAATVVEAVTVDATAVRRVQHAAGTSFRGAR